ncbi:MAG TPA: DUF4097 family beta strand repeat-containing protein [Acidobacteriaceae bacterium]|nr:DUF4097 family beta strand repeat-containing protein [Acidobacteriaceae bacterium]
MAASYPPPPNPGYGQGAPYDRATWKAQRRMGKDQARMFRAQMKAQREQMRWQRRSLRRGSLVGPLVLLGVGIVLLLAQTGRISWAHTLAWYGRWWPVVLIGAGVVLFAEWMLDQQRQDELGRPTGSRVLGGGVVFLLLLLAFVGWSVRWADTDAAWRNHYLGHDFGGLSRVLGEAHESDAATTQPIPAGAGLVIHNPFGAVSVTGSSDDGQVHVNIHKQVYAWHESEADEKANRMQPVFSMDGNNLKLDMSGMDQGQADLTVEVPRSSPLWLNADHGDVHVSEIHAPVTIASRTGDLDLSAINGVVSAHVNNDDASVTVRSVTGPFTLQGRAGDISLANIDGAVMLQGDFFGSTSIERVNGPVRFETSRTRFSTARVDGELQIERGDLQGNQLFGPVTLTTRDRSIQLDDVAGPVQVNNRNGAVSITSATPLGPVEITNQHGSVDLGLPANAGFSVDAQTRNGDLDNEFGLQVQGEQNRHTLTGTVGNGGPAVHVTTSDGDISIRKSAVPPVPPHAPAAPKISTAPAAPEHGAKAESKAKSKGPAEGPAVVPPPPAPPAPPMSAPERNSSEQPKTHAPALL